ncbi:MAG: hypothetical protein IPI67_38045 [Myxococcales bacterium]|nr:hypothetical protein [Myxococcales bacterium]
MTIHAPADLVQDAQLLEATLRPRLEAIGVESVDIVVQGSRSKAAYYVGYRLRPGATCSASDISEVVSLYFPAAVSYFSLQVLRAERLPETDPSVLEAQRKLRRPTASMLIFFGVLLAIPLVLVLGPAVSGRGDLLVTAGLRGAGSAEARFVANGKPIALWASLDGSWSKSSSSKTLRKILPVHYEVDAFLDGKLVHHWSIDTQTGRTQQKLFCTMAPDCEIFLEETPPLGPGPVLLKVTGTPRDDVVRVDDMSLNVRKATFF